MKNTVVKPCGERTTNCMQNVFYFSFNKIFVKLIKYSGIEFLYDCALFQFHGYICIKYNQLQ